MSACPICATPIALGCVRCPQCTVNLKFKGGEPVAAGWRGGDPVAAGQALRRVPKSNLEPADAPIVEPEPPQIPVGPCGTDGGYQRHRRRGERACDPCKLAHNAATRAEKARKKVAA